jgi:purine-nucleoside/S-methyl-5'-thioadenosine phosphorylase / adenosine deaminase
MLTSASLAVLPGVCHGFFTREGGVSAGLYASLNCGLGSGDDLDRVAENRTRALARLGLPAGRLATAYQVHSNRAAVAEAPWPADERPRVDALATRTPGLALGILTADCVPVLFADREAGVVAAAHAGWRGALDGVLEATLAVMQRLGARAASTQAAVGPAIEQPSYEVGPEFPTPFLDQDPANRDFFRAAPRRGHFLFDLKGYVARRLASAGVGEVESLAADTCADGARFFSYRRACLKGEQAYGRLLSAIALEP